MTARRGAISAVSAIAANAPLGVVAIVGRVASADTLNGFGVTLNPLLSATLPVPFDAVCASHEVPALDALLARSQAALDAIVATPGPRTYENTLEPLDMATLTLE